MEVKQLNAELKLKELSDAGTFSGTLSVYGNIDEGNEVVEYGAFTKSLKENGSKIPILEFHNGRSWNVGAAEVQDSPRALLITKATLNLNLDAGKQAYEALRFNRQHGIRTGLSIGYKTIKEKMENGVNYLKELRLFEGSLCVFPMNRECWVGDVKHAYSSEPEFDPDQALLELANVFRKSDGRLYTSADEVRLEMALKALR